MGKEKFLIVQTAFIGDAILATAVLEKIHQYYQNARIDFLIRKGNESLFKEHPFIEKLYVWEKKGGKYLKLFKILRAVRKEKYDYLINLQRFATTGFFTAFSLAHRKIGFKKNPFSFLFNLKIGHSIKNGMHEVERNQLLIKHLTDSKFARPVLYPAPDDFLEVLPLKSGPYICISPSSVWFTKQFPREKWVELINLIPQEYKIYLLGSTADSKQCEEILVQSNNPLVRNLAGQLNLLQSAALMKEAVMNFTNDSAPLHLASAMDAPVTAIFCSTVPGFGFGPLSTSSMIIETKEKLICRPCGLHGKKSCPKGHFKCALTIDTEQLIKSIKL